MKTLLTFGLSLGLLFFAINTGTAQIQIKTEATAVQSNDPVAVLINKMKTVYTLSHTQQHQISATFKDLLPWVAQGTLDYSSFKQKFVQEMKPVLGLTHQQHLNTNAEMNNLLNAVYRAQKQKASE